jgi:enoyl-[acyl-carrier-protein] reductase (NADH)
VGARSAFVTVRVAVRHMVRQGSGVILSLTSVQQVADAAVFVASDKGSVITAPIVNVSSGVSAS